MTDPGKLNDQVQRGEHAEKLLNDRLIAEFFDRAEQACKQVFANSELNERDLRELAYFRLQALGDVRACFTKTISDGEFAERELLRQRGQ